MFRRDVRVENLCQFDTSSKDAFVKSVVSLEDVAEEVARSWAEHGLYEMCEQKTRDCPKCGSQLGTWQARMCLSCGARFEPLSASETHNNTLKSQTPNGAA